MVIYFYDFFEFDSPYEEVNDDHISMEKEHANRVSNMKINHKFLYKKMQEGLNTEMYEKLFSVRMKNEKDILKLLRMQKREKLRKKKDKFNQNEDKTLIQFSILLKDEQFVEFLTSFGSKITEYFEEFVCKFNFL